MTKHVLFSQDKIMMTVLYAGDTTTAVVSLGGNEDINELITCAGVSKRGPGDKYDQQVAAQLALGRALQSAGKALIKRGNGLVKHHDDMRIRPKKPIGPGKSDLLKRIEAEDKAEKKFVASAKKKASFSTKAKSK